MEESDFPRDIYVQTVLLPQIAPKFSPAISYANAGLNTDVSEIFFNVRPILMKEAGDLIALENSAHFLRRLL
jgi:hypothetical protein